MCEACLNNDVAALCINSHSLAGNSANLGLRAIEKWARQIEGACKVNDFVKAVEITGLVESAWPEVVQQLEKIVAQAEHQ